MNHMKTISIATMLALGVATAASAQQRDGRDMHGGPPQRQGMQDHRNGPDRGPDRGRPGFDRSGPGAGPDHNWHRGDRLPTQYRSRQYVVDDWRGHRLSAPPRGYQWVQNGSDYVLVGIATGVIASLLLNH
jgi:Ni/Co efflux regulator RcnB